MGDIYNVQIHEIMTLGTGKKMQYFVVVVFLLFKYSLGYCPDITTPVDLA